MATTNAKPKRVDYITSSIGFALPLKFFDSDLDFPSKLSSKQNSIVKNTEQI